MAPEQASGLSVDGRADIYSLGCVVFECLVGRPPYPGTDVVAVLLAHSQQPVPGTGDPALDSFFLRALAKDPADRFATAGELSRALADAAGTGAVSALPRRRRPARRPRLRSVLAAVAGAAIATAILIVVSQHGGTAACSPAPSVSGAAPLPTVQPTPNRAGPQSVGGPGCSRYLVPTGWTVSGVTPEAHRSTVSLGRGGAPAALVVVAPAPGPAPTVAADSSVVPCPAADQTASAELGGLDGVFCRLRAGNPTDPDDLAYYVRAGPWAWTVVVKSSVPDAERGAFLASFAFGS
jgi:serine/threonine-protein kinase